MGVTGLWSVVSPTARPTRLETLNRKRLAVDASIWIYQFLKAVRDKEGNALRNSHVIGFFRRICKLLYFGILPVFVFDGGAPGLKRETIQKRRRRREGRREDAARTAGKLLAVQVARAAEEEDRKRKAARQREEEEQIPEDEDLVYVEELGMNRQEREKERGTRFKKKDQYHLPDLDVSIEAMGAPNDPRIMSQAELEEYARQFHSGEDINLYDFSKIDFESPFFLSLPAGDRYNILNAARLRSRLRMGYSKEQLDGMFPDRMDFSRFQIERVRERNELTQRLMHINGMNEDWDAGGRIAGEKGKEYILVKNEGVEGGWALGVVSNKQGSRKEDAIDIDEEGESGENMEDDEDDDEFEDVAVEGLNRLPKILKRNRKEIKETDYDVSYEEAAERIAQKRKTVYAERKRKALVNTTSTAQKYTSTTARSSNQTRHDDDLFVAQDDENEGDDVFEDVPMEVLEENEDDELQRAIAMSLEDQESMDGFANEDRNPESTKDTDSDDGEMDLAAALAESRRSKHKLQTNIRTPPPLKAPEHNFSGPLPFESLNLGQSLLGKKKADKVEQDMSGGFDRDTGDHAFQQSKKAQPVPSWFQASATTEPARYEEQDDFDDHVTYGREDVDRRELLRQQPTHEVIDLEASEDDDETREEDHSRNDDLYYGEKDDEPSVEEKDGSNAQEEIVTNDQETVGDDNQEQAEKKKAAQEREERYELARAIAAENEGGGPEGEQPILMEDVADYAQANPPPPQEIAGSIPKYQPLPQAVSEHASEEEDDHDDIEWSESDEDAANDRDQKAGNEAGGDEEQRLSDNDDGEFEDVDMENRSGRTTPPPALQSEHEMGTQFFEVDEDEGEEVPTQDGTDRQEIDDYFSESDEELMRQLALEAEGHAEFASSLNQMKTPAQATRDYENELKQLRNQQKKDRRDADEVTQVMVQECQALLRLFGLPYITAPMEAEAQCAELVHLGLVDGIVTDDSDIFLFGGTRIYKNMFNAAKFVECYLTQDLEKEYDLDRNKLIRFAHLLGSDYTEGIPGIGPVTALEIISDFHDLEEFKEWCSKVQLGRPQDLENSLTTPFRRKFKKTVQKKLFLPPVFPDLRVDYAYLNPEVDSNQEEFQWGVPDLDKLRGFLMATIGWSQDRTDEILVPVIRDMNKRGLEGTQANITKFFTGGTGSGAAAVDAAAPRNRTGKESGRMKNAYARLRGEARRRRMQADESEGNEEADVNGNHNDDNNDDDATKDQLNVNKRKSALPSSPPDDMDEEDEFIPKSKRSKVEKRKVKF